MRICRYDDNRLGLVLDTHLVDVTSVLDLLPKIRYPLPAYDPLIANLDRLVPAIEAVKSVSKRISTTDVRMLSPVANPGKLIAAPLNYGKHHQAMCGGATFRRAIRVSEIQRAGLFLKAPSSIVGMSQGIQLNQPDRRTDHEVELAVIIGRSAKNVSAADALEHVAGYTIALDVAIRGPEEPSMRHSPDSYSVLGPWIVTANELPDASDLDIELSVNGAIRQKSSTSDLIIGVAELIELASRFYTLQPGDVICTGTPEGVGPVNAGDLLVVSIQGIGEMRVTVSGATSTR